jgi:hypothetical protein
MFELTTTAGWPVALERARRLVPSLAAFVAGAGPVVLLGFSRGGYPVEVVAGYGVALWWLLLVGFLTDAIPRPSPTRLGWVALVALAGLVGWGALSLTQSADAERGLTEVSRLIVAAGSVLLGMSAVRAGQARTLAGGVLAGLTAIVAGAVLTRLFPDLVADATATSDFLAATRMRLAWPLNYWNANAASAAVAIALGLALAARSRTVWTSAAALAPLPILALGLAYTLSRGGMGAIAVACITLLALVAPRPLVLRTALVAAVGVAVVLEAGLRPDALTDVVGGEAQVSAGRRVFAVLLVATAGVAVLQAGLRTADLAHWTPRIPRPTGHVAAGIAAAAIVGAIILALTIDVPTRVGDGWDSFRDRRVTASVQTDNSAERLSSVSGNGRYQIWSGALDAFADAPLRGIGLGSWESWWNPNRGETGFVRNAHSEPFELLAETGIFGAALFLSIIFVPIAAGAVSVMRRRTSQPDGILVVPALVAFALAVAVDWNWQIGALMVAGMTLAAIPLARPSAAPERDLPPRAPGTRGRRLLAVTGLGLAAVGSIVVLALALVAPQSVQASREALARNDQRAAAAEAARGESAAAFAASPALQSALVAEQAGDLAEAEAAARRAAQRTPGDWRPWFLIARLATAQGEEREAIAAFRRAKALNPESALLR